MTEGQERIYILTASLVRVRAALQVLNGGVSVCLREEDGIEIQVEANRVLRRLKAKLEASLEASLKEERS